MQNINAPEKVIMSQKQSLEYLASQMDQERQTYMPQWRDVCDYLMPTRPKWQITDHNKGDRRNQKIIDSTACFAHRTARAGIMSGVTSPARPWFRLSIPDKELAESGAVKNWLYDVGGRMNNMFLRSNLYQVLPSVYGDMLGISTGCMLAERDLDSVLRFYSIPMGSYCLSLDDKLRVRVFYRDLQYNVRQLIEKFGMTDPDRPDEIDWSKFSNTVKTLYSQKNMEATIQVRHFILPNPDFDPRKAQSKFKRFLSCYYERAYMGAGPSPIGSDMADDVYLREAGYDYFPVLAPRWEVSGEDIYGNNCPGFEALGDIRALQLMQKRKAQGIEKQMNPPLRAFNSLKNQNIQGLPGRTTYVDPNGTQAGVAPIYEVRPDINGMLLDIQDHQQRIRRAFYEDLFLMLASSNDPNRTATEIIERKEEKLLALGPVLEQLNQDLLDPLIDIAFFEMLEQGQIPEPPPEIQGMDIRVEYISIMAQSQKLIGIGSLERFLGMVGQIASFDPSVLDKVDADQAVDEYADMTSVPPRVVRSDEVAAEIRAKRNEAAAAQAQSEQMAQAAQSAKNLSQASLDGNNALNATLNQAQVGAV
jgi:hypothetical protein